MIVDVPGKGRCVFADKIYKKGETIEICEYITIPQPQIDILKGTVLNDYRFGDNGDQGDARIFLGNGSLYNHSNDPNMVAVCDHDRVGFVAFKDIKVGDELVFDYGYTPNGYLLGNMAIVGKVKGKDIKKTGK